MFRMHSERWAVLGAALTIACGAVAQQAVLRPQALVTGVNVRLSDVAELANLDASTAARLADLTVGTSPRVGSSPQQWPRATIEQRVRAQTGALALRWSGPDAIEVQRAASVVPGSDIVDEGAVQLYRRLAAEGQRVAIQPLDQLADIAVARGRISLVARPLTYSEALRRRATVWVDIYVDGVVQRSVAVNYRVEVWRDAWLLRESAAAGQTLRCADLDRREIDVAVAPHAFPANSGMACKEGWRLRHALAAGDVLGGDAVAPPGAPIAGDVVALRLRGRGILVEMPAVVADGTDRSDPARVRVRLAGRTVDARATGPGTVDFVAQMGGR